MKTASPINTNTINSQLHETINRQLHEQLINTDFMDSYFSHPFPTELLKETQPFPTTMLGRAQPFPTDLPNDTVDKELTPPNNYVGKEFTLPNSSVGKGKSHFISLLYHYDHLHTTTYDRFRNLMFSVNVSLSFLLVYIGNIYEHLIMLYLILWLDAALAFMVEYKKHISLTNDYVDKGTALPNGVVGKGIWATIRKTLHAFHWSRFLHGSIFKAFVYSLLLLIMYMLAHTLEQPLLYRAVLLLFMASETKSLDKHLYRLFGISLYEKLTAVLLKGPLSFLNVKNDAISTENTTNKNNTEENNNTEKNNNMGKEQ